MELVAERPSRWAADGGADDADKYEPSRERARTAELDQGCVRAGQP